ncbi:MAG: hypothetical protein JXO72_14225, partial [Vicinamibacteria bacterium]|nr:hypothetical protein [Vicinamibacteria bacterium]
SLIGSPNVLANPAVGVEGSMFVANVVGKSFLAINGSADPLYPAESERPLLDAFRNAGADVTFEVENSGHDTSWHPKRAPQIEAFIDAHPRDPLPERVMLATELTDRANRMSWVVIDELADTPAKLGVLGLPPKRAGGLVAERKGNTVEVVAIGIRRCRLLLSPEEFDLGAEVVVRTNDQESFRSRVQPSLDTLLEWAAEDVDRAMLFAAQLEMRSKMQGGPARRHTSGSFSSESWWCQSHREGTVIQCK